MSFHRAIFFLLIIPLLTSVKSLALFEPGLFFYRSTKSLFPSGQKSKSELQTAKIRTINEDSYLIEKNNKQYRLDTEKVLRDIDLSNKFISAGLPDTQDLGLAVNVISCSLHKKPNWSSTSLSQIPSRTKLEFLGIESTWAYVRYKAFGVNLTGYVDLNNLVLKADYASFILNSDNQWRPVKYRELSQLVLDQNERIDITKIKAMVTRSDEGIVIIKDPKLDLPLKSHVIIKKINGGSWNVSLLKGHGQVYWRQDVANSDANSKTYFINTDQLLKREITSTAFHPKNPNWGLVSSHGIYLTTDGKNWKKIETFGNYDYPVAIGPNGELVVGTQISRDFGKNFRSYLRWDNMTKLIEGEARKNARTLTIKDLIFNKSGELHLTLDTGVNKIRIKGIPSDSDSWRLAQK